MLRTRVPWNESGARAKAKSRGEKITAEYVAKIPKRRAVVTAKHKPWRKIGAR